jgi:hypothetical protein
MSCPKCEGLSTHIVGGPTCLRNQLAQRTAERDELLAAAKAAESLIMDNIEVLVLDQCCTHAGTAASDLRIAIAKCEGGKP